MRDYRLGSGIEIVQKAERVVPFQRHGFVLKPCVCPRDLGIDQVVVEESVQLGEEEG